MIVVASIDHEALRERSDADGDAYHALKSLAKVLRQHGVLHLTGPEDVNQLFAAVKSLDPMIGEVWEATLISLGSLGRIRADTSDVSTHESCMTSPLLTANLRPSDLVVLSDPACDIQRVPRRPGHLQRSDEPELASVAAVHTCSTVDRIDELVENPYTRQGESRELTWTNFMAPLARLAHREVEVRVLDRFLFRKFLDGRDGELDHIAWLLAKLNEDLPPDVTVHLIAEDLVWREKEERGDWYKRRKQRTGRLRKWLKSQAFTSDRPGALRVSLAPWREVEGEQGQRMGKPHDRHIRFNAWVALATPEGFDRVKKQAVFGEDGMVLNRVMATNDEGRDDYFSSLLNKENTVLNNALWSSEPINQFQRGQIRNGVVSSIEDFGAFVDLGGVDGLVHVSKLPWGHIDNPIEAVTVGDEVTVEVLNANAARERVSLAIKANRRDPWQHFARTHHIGQVVPGKVTQLVPSGAFVRVEEGIEGLVDIAELAERPVEIPEQVVTVNDDIFVKVIRMNPKNRWLSLSLKQASAGGPTG